MLLRYQEHDVNTLQALAGLYRSNKLSFCVLCRWDEGWNHSLSSIANFSRQLRPWFKNDTISTIFLGDEICCPSGCPKRHGKGFPAHVTAVNFTQNASAIVRELRKAVGPKPLLYLNTCPDVRFCRLLC